MFAVNVIGPAVPDHHGAATILSLWDNSFEVLILNRMIFNFDRKMFLGSLPGESLG